MKIYIDGEKLMESFYDTPESNRSWSRAWWLINHAKLADVRENVRGEWQPIEVQPYFKKHFDTSVACSVCHRKGNKRWNFCPNCGADMRGDKP